MPVVLRVRGYRFWFYEADLDEPAHVHVAKGRQEAKYWLEPVRMARAGRFKPVEFLDDRGIIKEQ